MFLCSVLAAFMLRVTLLCDRYVIAELIETEKDYVKDLGLIVEVHITSA